ncbi:MAG: hypothetical protein Q4Q07_03165 [Tissierellia bacterium]|nr:hypothetical protein [Tissierellia bacterium]
MKKHLGFILLLIVTISIVYARQEKELYYMKDLVEKPHDVVSVGYDDRNTFKIFGTRDEERISQRLDQVTDTIDEILEDKNINTSFDFRMKLYENADVELLKALDISVVKGNDVFFHQQGIKY